MIRLRAGLTQINQQSSRLIHAVENIHDDNRDHNMYQNQRIHDLIEQVR